MTKEAIVLDPGLEGQNFNSMMTEGLSEESVLVRLAREKTMGSLLESIVREAQDICHADGGTLYLLEHQDGKPVLSFYVLLNHRLKVRINQAQDHPYEVDSPSVGINKPSFPAIPLLKEDGSDNFSHVAAFCAINRQLTNIKDVYHVSDFDFSGAMKFDKTHHYRTQSILTIPLQDHDQEVIGVMQLINARDEYTDEIIAFSKDKVSLISAMSVYASLALNNLLLVFNHKQLLESFIQSLASMTDHRSPHTSAHCQRLPYIMTLIAESVVECNDGELKDFSLTAEEWYELKVSAWLHDCGKLATPDYLIDKATKLMKPHDRISEVRARFSSLIKDFEIEMLRNVLANPSDKEKLTAQFEEKKKLIQEDLMFIERVNLGGEFLSEEDQKRIRSLSHYVWKDEFGQDAALFSEEELVNLCISRGTLNDDERAIMNQHIDVTIEVLESLPFPKPLRRVPEYAGCHHEKIDGSGFPRGLTREQMSIPARMMAIADIFEALTAKERPYKPPMKLSQVFQILKGLKDNNKIDDDIYQTFLKSKKWQTYAQQHMADEQSDVDDITPYL